MQSWIDENIGWNGAGWRSECAGDFVILRLDCGFQRDRKARPGRSAAPGNVDEPRRPAPSPGANCRLGGRRRGSSVVLKGLIAGMSVLGGFEPRLARVLKSLERELSVQILPDGGHLSRSPSLQLQVLQDLIDTRAVLRSAQIAVRCAQRCHRANGADAALFSPWRPPAGSVQRFARGRRGSYRPRSNTVRDRGVRPVARPTPASTGCKPSRASF